MKWRLDGKQINAVSTAWLALVLFFVPFNLLASTSAASLKPIQVQLSWNHQFQFAGFYAAIQQGYYQERGLEVTVKPWQPTMNLVDEVVSGRADYASGYSSVIGDFAQGAPVKIIMATLQYSPMVLLAHEPVEHLSELAGKRIMHNGNLQVSALINKVNALCDKPLKEQATHANLNDFINRKTDLYAAYRTNELYQLKQQNVDYSVVDPKTYGINSYGDMVFTSAEKANQQADEVLAFKDATIQGWQYALQHPEAIVDYLLENYPVQKTRDALLSEASLIAEYVDGGQASIGYIDNAKLMANAKQVQEAGMMTLDEYDLLDYEELLFHPIQVFLTDEEKAYLAANPILKVGNDFNWPPFDFINDKGHYDGIISDYIKWIGRALNLQLETLTDTPWHQILEDLKHGKLDVAPGAMDTPERRGYLEFTQPYMRFPLVIMARQDVGFINGLEQLAGEKVAVPKGWYSEEYILSNYPEIEVVSVASITEGLEAVISGRADFYFGNLAAINYQLKEHNISGLKAVGTVKGEYFKLTMAVTKGNEVLRSILQKTINAMPEAEKKRIYNRWIQLEVVHQTDYGLLFKWLGAGAVVTVLLLALLLWMQKQRQKQQDYIKNIHELSLATYTSYPDLVITWSSESFAKLTGYTKDELEGMAHTKLKAFPEDEVTYDEVIHAIGQGKVWKGEVRASKKNGEIYWIDAVCTPEIVHDEVKGIWTTRTDITSKKGLQELTIRDALTEVYNRRHFNDVFEIEVNRANRKQDGLALAILDIDLFKKVNDVYGHQRGDEVLVEVAGVLKQHAHRAGDAVFRIGGEEFALIGDFNDFAVFETYLETLRKGVETLKIENSESPYGCLTVSIGGVFCQQNEVDSGREIFAIADKALYQAKSAGRNRVVLTTK